MSFDINESWQKYSQLMKERPEEFDNSGLLKIVLDEKTFKEYHRSQGINIGFIYESSYNILLVDLVEDHEGRRFTYERLLPKSTENGVVVIPMLDGKFVLVNQYRHALRADQWAFPRGYGENGLNDEANAVQELKDELNADIGQLIKLGTMVADSGLSGRKVSIFLAKIHSYEFKPYYEELENIKEVTQDQLEKMILDHVINDGFTLSAYSLFLLGKTI